MKRAKRAILGRKWSGAALWGVGAALAAALGIMAWIGLSPWQGQSPGLERERGREERAREPAEESPSGNGGVPAEDEGGPEGLPALAEMAEAEKDRALREEQLEVARKLLADYPKNDDAVYFAGLIYDEQGDSARAIELWERALELDPSRADACESLGHAWLLRDEYGAAEAYLRQAIELDPNARRARFRLALTYLYQGKAAEAKQLLEEADELTPEMHRLHGQACQSLGDLDQAAGSFKTAIRLDPELAEAHYGLARAYTRQGKPKKAARHQQEFAALRKQSDRRKRASRRSFDSLAVTRESVAETWMDAGRIYARYGRRKQAEELWLRAAALDPENILSRLQLGTFYYQKGAPEQALDYFREAAELDPSDPMVHWHIGQAALELDRLDEAEAAFRKVTELAPKRPEGYDSLARLLWRRRDAPDEALESAEKAAELNPSAARLAFLSRMYAQQGDRKRALKTIQKAIEMDPDETRYLQFRERLQGK